VTEIAAATHAGRVRPSNEDHHTIDDRVGFAVIADGMAGERGGELAAECACLAITRLARAATPGAPILEAAFAHAAERVALLADPGIDGPAATVAAVRVSDDAVEIAHVGDVRVYLLRVAPAIAPAAAAPTYCPPVTLPSGSIFTCLTRDHSSLCELVERGHVAPEAAARHALRGQVSRALGRSRTDADVARIPIAPGDRLLLCSDGLWAVVPGETLAATLERLPPATACEALIELALAAGGGDNITVAIVKGGP
jgi:serine/threonine protein phosphatase PrpC